MKRNELVKERALRRKKANEASKLLELCRDRVKNKYKNKKS